MPGHNTCAQPDMESSCHSPVTYVPISHHLYLLVPSLFPAHIHFDLPTFYLSHLCLTPAVAELGIYCPLSSLF